MSIEKDSFLARWSRRKTQAQAPAPMAEPLEPVPVDGPAHAGADVAVQANLDSATPASSTQAPPTAPASSPVLTLQDVAQLTGESDFKPFAASHVPAAVRNAAMKKLFSAPHYNVMDGLDIYIDDYSLPSPLSQALRDKMVSAQFLQLIQEPAPEPVHTPAAALGPAHHDPSVASLHATDSAHRPPPDLAPPTPHDHADLQLQPDHAPEHSGPECGAA